LKPVPKLRVVTVAIFF